MNFLSFNTLLIITTLATTNAFGKRPPRDKPPKPPKQALSQEQKQVILANVAQVMGGICTIAQDPHNAHAIGSSVGAMIQALINIIVERLAKRTININDTQVIEECLDTLCKDISKEITEIIIAQTLLEKI